MGWLLTFWGCTLWDGNLLVSFNQGNFEKMLQPTHIIWYLSSTCPVTGRVPGAKLLWNQVDQGCPGRVWAANTCFFEGEKIFFSDAVPGTTNMGSGHGGYAVAGAPVIDCAANSLFKAKYKQIWSKYLIVLKLIKQVLLACLASKWINTFYMQNK